MPRRPLLLASLLAACLTIGGCLQTLGTALLAPEALAIQGAAGGAQELGAALTSAGPLSDAQSVSDDLDRILAENDAAKERPELQALGDKLRAQAENPGYRRREGSAANEPERRAELDRRVEVAPDQRRVVSDRVQLGGVSRLLRRPDGRPQPQPEPTPLDPWEPRVHLMDFTQIRVK